MLQRESVDRAAELDGGPERVDLAHLARSHQRVGGCLQLGDQRHHVLGEPDAFLGQTERAERLRRLGDDLPLGVPCCPGGPRQIRPGGAGPDPALALDLHDLLEPDAASAEIPAFTRDLPPRAPAHVAIEDELRVERVEAGLLEPPTADVDLLSHDGKVPVSGERLLDGLREGQLEHCGQPWLRRSCGGSPRRDHEHRRRREKREKIVEYAHTKLPPERR